MKYKEMRPVEGAGGILDIETYRSIAAFRLSSGDELSVPGRDLRNLALSNVIHLPFIYRYDAILLVLLGVQYFMYRSGLETRDEIKVICLFHLIGLALELYKVHMGSWSYPSLHIRSCLESRSTAGLCMRV